MVLHVGCQNLSDHTDLIHNNHFPERCDYASNFAAREQLQYFRALDVSERVQALQRLLLSGAAGRGVKTRAIRINHQMDKLQAL